MTTDFGATNIAYNEFDIATNDLIPGVDASFILELMRISLQNPKIFSWACKRMSVSDWVMNSIINVISRITDDPGKVESTKQLVLVYVKGGLVQETKEPANVTVKIWDDDNFDEGGNECPNCFYQPNEDETGEAKEGFVVLEDLDNCPQCGVPFGETIPNIYNWLIMNGELDKENNNEK